MGMIILLVCPLFKFSWDASFMGTLAGAGAELNSKLSEIRFGQKFVAWVTLLLGAFLPIIFIVRRQVVSKLMKGIALALVTPAILFALRIVSDEGSQYNPVVSVAYGPTTWAWLYLASLICCVVGIVKFGIKKKDHSSP